MNSESKCPLCGEFSSIVDRDYKSRSGFIYRLARCPRCEFQFKLTKDDLNEIYRHVYDEGEYVMDRGALSANRPERSYVPEFLIERIPQGGLVLEVGPGSGGNLLYAKDLGYRTATLDVSSWNNEYFRTQCHFDHVHESMDTIPDNSLDGVMATHVIEHVSDPAGFLSVLRTKMKEGAWLLIGTPNCDYPYTTFFGNRWWVYGVDDHVSFFKSSSLRHALEQAQYKDIGISTHNSNGSHSVSWFLRSGLRGIPYGQRDRKPGVSVKSPSVSPSQESPTGLPSPIAPSPHRSGSGARGMVQFILEQPFRNFTAAGHGYELVSVSRK
jgi:2-polyprenyl-3-methyl-5-hydroxy-6-metoxy-1,4-benzoquinol methylase